MTVEMEKIIENDYSLNMNLYKEIVLDVNGDVEVVELGDKYSIDDLLVNNVRDKNLAMLISEMTYNKDLPVPFGVFYKEDKVTYEDMMVNQINESIKIKGNPDLQSLINGPEVWEVK